MHDTERAERLAVIADQLTTLRAERDDLIRALRDSGWTLQRIAQHAGITAQAVHKVLNPRPKPRVEVADADGVPVVKLHNHQDFESGVALADEIIRQVNASEHRPATPEEAVHAYLDAMLLRIKQMENGDA